MHSATRRLAAPFLLLLAALALPGCRLLFGTSVETGVVHATDRSEAEVLVVADMAAVARAAVETMRAAGAAEIVEHAGRVVGRIDGLPAAVYWRASEGGAVRVTAVATDPDGSDGPATEIALDLATGVRDRLR